MLTFRAALLCAWATAALAQSPPPPVLIPSGALQHNFRVLKEERETAQYCMADHNAPFAISGGASFVSETSVATRSVLIDSVENEPLRADYARPPIVSSPQLK